MANDPTKEEITEFHAKDQADKLTRKEAYSKAIRDFAYGAEGAEEPTGAVAGAAGISPPESTFTPVYTSARARRQDLYGE